MLAALLTQGNRRRERFDMELMEKAVQASRMGEYMGEATE